MRNINREKHKEEFVSILLCNSRKIHTGKNNNISANLSSGTVKENVEIKEAAENWDGGEARTFREDRIARERGDCLTGRFQTRKSKVDKVDTIVALTSCGYPEKFENLESSDGSFCFSFVLVHGPRILVRGDNMKKRRGNVRHMPTVRPVCTTRCHATQSCET